MAQQDGRSLHAHRRRHRRACGIDFGVYGVPETFVVGSDGHIAHKHIGAITPQALNEVILPLVERLRKNPKEGNS